MNFWEKICRGHILLTPFEDALLWKMRAAGKSWDAIEELINALRRNRALSEAANASA